MSTSTMPAAMRFGPVDVSFDESVLRPRPWTLAQSEWACDLSDGGVMLELGCGAGQIGLAAAMLALCPVVQVDRDPLAVRWAGHNAAANGFAHLVEQRCGTAGQVLAEDERFGVVIADPPYVPSSDVHLYPDDPLKAIDGGPDGLESVRSFLRDVAGHVRPGGSVVLQVGGQAQAEALARWLEHPAAPGLAVVEARSYGPVRALARLKLIPDRTAAAR